MAVVARLMQIPILVLLTPTLAFAEIVIIVKFITTGIPIRFIMLVIASFLQLVSRRHNIDPPLYRTRVCHLQLRNFR